MLAQYFLSQKIFPDAALLPALPADQRCLLDGGNIADAHGALAEPFFETALGEYAYHIALREHARLHGYLADARPQGALP